MKNIVKYSALCLLLITSATQLLCMQEQELKNTATLHIQVKKYSCTQVLVKSAAIVSSFTTGIATGITTMTATKIAMAAVRCGIVHTDSTADIIVTKILQSPIDISLFTGLAAYIGGAYFGYNGIIWGYNGIRNAMQKKHAKNAAARAKIMRIQEEHKEQ